MILKIKNCLAAVMMIVAFGACKKIVDTGIMNTGNFPTDGPSLKSAADFPVGVALSYGPLMNDPEYGKLVAQEFSQVVFDYNMKHHAIVQDNGKFVFSKADEMVAFATNAGLDIFGHTLVWHQNQNGTYLNTLTGGAGGSDIVNLISNPGFEDGMSGWYVSNTGDPAGSSSVGVTTTPSEVRTGTSALKVVVDKSYGGSQWRVQMFSPAFAAENGKTYNVSFWIKSAAAGGSIRLSATPTGTVTNAYQGDQDGLGTDWQQVTWSITMNANTPNQQISFDMGKTAGTYFIDDVQVWNPDAPPPPPLMSNGGFEDGISGWSVSNTGDPAGTSSIGITSASSEIRTGNSALKVVTDKSYGTSQWRVQAFSPAFAAESGKTYNVSFWIKAATAGGSIRLSATPTGTVTNAYQGDQDGLGTDWQQVSWSITMTANEPNQRISFDMGKTANTYFIDDVVVVDAATSGGGSSGSGDAGEKVDEAMKDFITAMVTRYKGKVSAWDVVNEPMVESGAIRNSSNTTIPSTSDPNDYFFWADYLGRDYALKAFNYAKAADPDALLFINDYNLESNATKLDSLIAYVDYLKGKGAKVDGIGTQMHVTVNSSYDGIDNMFKKLAATGLMIRISEMDVKINPLGKSDYSTIAVPEVLFASQADMYKYIVGSYMKNIPPAQRAGITVWGLDDKDSWLYNDGKDFPLLFDNNYKRKPAYGGFLEGLKQQ